MTTTTLRTSDLPGMSAATILVVALCLGACGEKPKPKPATTPATTAAGAPGEPGPGAETPPPPPERTRGGIDLDIALDSAGDQREAVFAAAQALSQDRAAGVKGLAAKKGLAKATVVALLGSKNLDEMIGAMLVLQAEGDPTGARAEAQDAVLGLLDHEVPAVRDVAWETAAQIADGEALAKLLPTLTPERKLAVVRLLAAWDGEPVRAALWSLVTGADAALAIESALAASAPGKRLDEALEARLEALAKDDSEAHLRLALIMRRRLAAGDAKAKPPSKEAIDRALGAKDEALVLEGIRSSLALVPEDRAPLYEQLASDPRAAVRAVCAEMLARHAESSGGAAAAKSLALATALSDKLLGDPEGDVRMAAAAARARFGKPEERIKALLPRLADSHRGVRLATAVSLAEPELVGGSVEALVKQLDREDDAGRKSILGALASADRREPLAALIALLQSPDKTRVVAVHFALSTATKQDFAGDAGAWRAWLDKRYPPPPPPEK